MAAYATQTEFEAYVEGWSTTNPTALARLLERASYDIDSLVGHWSIEANGLKFGAPAGANEKGLTDAQKRALSRATCAQAEYRYEMGEGFFAQAQYDSVSGPDFATQGRRPYVGPKVWAELADTGLLRLTTTIGPERAQPPWYSFAYNTDED